MATEKLSAVHINLGGCGRVFRLPCNNFCFSSPAKMPFGCFVWLETIFFVFLTFFLSYGQLILSLWVRKLKAEKF